MSRLRKVLFLVMMMAIMSSAWAGFPGFRVWNVWGSHIDRDFNGPVVTSAVDNLPLYVFHEQKQDYYPGFIVYVVDPATGIVTMTGASVQSEDPFYSNLPIMGSVNLEGQTFTELEVSSSDTVLGEGVYYIDIWEYDPYNVQPTISYTGTKLYIDNSNPILHGVSVDDVAHELIVDTYDANLTSFCSTTEITSGTCPVNIDSIYVSTVIDSSSHNLTPKSMTINPVDGHTIAVFDLNHLPPGTYSDQRINFTIHDKGTNRTLTSSVATFTVPNYGPVITLQYNGKNMGSSGTVVSEITSVYAKIFDYNLPTNVITMNVSGGPGGANVNIPFTTIADNNYLTDVNLFTSSSPDDYTLTVTAQDGHGEQTIAQTTFTYNKNDELYNLPGYRITDKNGITHDVDNTPIIITSMSSTVPPAMLHTPNPDYWPMLYVYTLSNHDQIGGGTTLSKCCKDTINLATDTVNITGTPELVEINPTWVPITFEGRYIFRPQSISQQPLIYPDIDYVDSVIVVDNTGPTVAQNQLDDTADTLTVGAQDVNRNLYCTADQMNADTCVVKVEGMQSTTVINSSLYTMNTVSLIHDPVSSLHYGIFDLSQLPEGTYTNQAITTTVTDAAGNVTTYVDTYSFTVDKTAPTISVTYDGATYSGQAINDTSLLSVTLSDVVGGVSLTSVNITGGPNSLNTALSTTDLGTGTYSVEALVSLVDSASVNDYTLTITGQDDAGNTAVFSTPFSVDRIDPTIEVRYDGAPFTSGVVQDLAMVSVAINDNLAAGSVTSATIQGGPGAINQAVTLSNNGDGTYTLNPITIAASSAQDDYLLEVTAEDSVGNQATTTVNFTYSQLTLSSIGVDSMYDYFFIAEYRILNDGSYLVPGYGVSVYYTTLTGADPLTTTVTATSINQQTSTAYGPINLTYIPETDRFTINTAYPDLFPETGTYELTFTAVDSYNTQTQVSHTVSIDREAIPAGSQTGLVGIYDPASPEAKMSGFPGAENYVAYSESMVVYTTPTHGLYKAELTNAHPETIFGIAENADVPYLQVTRITDSSTDAYYKTADMIITSTQPSYYFGRIADFSTNYTSNYVLLAGSPTLPLPPKPLGLNIWLSNGDNAANSNSTQPNDITTIRVNVQERMVDQIATVSDQDGNELFTATIPVGELGITVDLENPVILTGAGRMQFQVAVSLDDVDPQTRSISAYVVYDRDLPVYDNYSVNDTNRLIELYYHDEARISNTYYYYFTTWNSRARLGNNGQMSNWMSRTYQLEEPSRGNYHSKFNMDSANDGIYNEIQFKMSDSKGNDTLVTIPHDITIDNNGPTIDIENAGVPFTGGDVVTLDDLLVNLTDVVGGQKLDSVSVSGGILSTPVQVTWGDESGDYRLVHPELTASIYAGGYTLSIQASDVSGNITTQEYDFNYAPPMVSEVNIGGDTVYIPAINHEFKDDEGHGWVRSVEIPSLTGMYDVQASLSSDATASFTVNGQIINPGETLPVGSTNFDETGHRYIAAVAPTSSGTIELGTLVLSTAAPNTPGFEANLQTWTGDFTIEMDKASVEQSIEPYFMHAKALGDTRCELTSNLLHAQQADMNMRPKCLIEWSSIPDEGHLVNTEPSVLKGYAYALGAQNIALNVYMVDSDGSQFPFGSVASVLNVNPANFDAEILPDKIDFAVFAEDLKLDASQKSGPPCLMTADSTIETRPACLVTWTTVPVGLAQQEYFDPALVGRLSEIGENFLEYNVKALTTNGHEIDLGTYNHTLTGVVPDAPNLEILYTTPITVNNVDYYPVQKQGGRVGVVEVSGMPGDITYEVSGYTTSVSTYQYEYRSRSLYSKFTQTLAVDQNTLWDVDDIDVSAYYTDVQTSRTTRTFKTLWVPSNRVIGRVRVAGSINDDAPVTIEADIGIQSSDGNFIYDPSVSGQWKAYLYTLNPDKSENPITPSKTLDVNGKATFDVDLPAHDTARIFAKYVAITPIQDLVYTISSKSYVLVTPVKMTGISSTIKSGRLSGPAPYRAYFSLVLDDIRDSRSVGGIKWELSSNGGQWTEITESRDSLRLYKEFPVGEYDIRAQVTNSNSGVITTSQVIHIISYERPELEIEGPSTAFINSDVTLNAITSINGSPAQAEVTWDVVTTGDQVSGTSFTSTITDHLKIIVKARLPDAPADDVNAYTTKIWYIRAADLVPPVSVIVGPTRAETGNQTTYTATNKSRINGIIEPISGYWTLPDGSKVYSEVLNWTPSVDDIGYVTLNYTSYFDNYNDGTNEYTRSIRVYVWEYIWPEFDARIVQTFEAAPATISFYIKGADGYYLSSAMLKSYQYDWTLPQGISNVYQRDTYTRFTANTPGSYPISVTISDDRGNQKTLTRVIDLATPPNLTAEVKVTSRNKLMRAPYEYYATAIIDGGHPIDRVSNYYWMTLENGQWTNHNIDNGEFTTKTLRDTVELPQTATVKVTALSNLNEMVAATKNITVVPNQPPVCQVVGYMPYAYRTDMWRFTAYCDDPDGYIVSHRWYMNGEIYPPAITRYASFSYQGEFPINVTYKATDDADAEVTVNYVASP